MKTYRGKETELTIPVTEGQLADLERVAKLRGYPDVTAWLQAFFARQIAMETKIETKEVNNG